MTFVRWELILLLFSFLFMRSVLALRGNQIIIIDKSIIRNLIILLSILIIILINQSGGGYFNNKNSYKIYCLNIIFIIIILFVCFYSTNFLIFYFFFELVVIPTFFIVLGWGYSPERIQAGNYLFLYTLLASLPFLIYILIFFKNNSSSIFDLLNFFTGSNVNKIIWVPIRLIFIVKIPIFLLHI